MKYMVEINAKFLVKIEIDGSCGSAEHYFLDKFPAVWGANAFDEKSMKTECFRGTLLNSELVSEKELSELLEEAEKADKKAADLEAEIKWYKETEQEMLRKLESFRKEYRERMNDLTEARNEKNRIGSRINSRTI